MKKQRTLGILLLTGAMLLAGFTSNALAWTSAACDPITNQATLSYSVGGVGQTAIDSDDPSTGALGDGTTFYVGTLVDLTVATVNSPVNATGTDQVLTFQIDNTGNDTQRYGLQLYEGLDATDDQFNMNNVRVYTDTNATFDPGLADGEVLIEDPAPVDGTTLAALTSDVAANGTLYVHVVSDVPAGQTALDESDYTLRALTYQIDAAGYNGSDGNQGTETGNSAIDLTSNNCVTGGNTGVVPVDGLSIDTPVDGVPADSTNDGDYFATGTYVVATSAITVEKTSSILWDPVNGDSSPVAIPGAYIQYEIAISNAAGAGASATLAIITDTLQALNLVIDPDLITGGDLDPSDGPYESASGDGFKIVVTGSTRGDNGNDQFFTTADDAPDDGVMHVAGVITATYADILPAEAGYTDGELKPGETVTLTFNAIIQ